MTGRRTLGPDAPTLRAADKDKLLRLIRMFARQAAEEAFEVFKDALEASRAPAKPLSDPQRQLEAADETASNTLRSAEPDERFLGVARVAERLDVSQKTVRRKIAAGELPAHRVGKLLRISERDLAAFVKNCTSMINKKNSRYRRM
jgi:excisionase family DNA binding protein